MSFRHRVHDYTGYALLRECLHSWNRPKAVFIWIPKSAGTSLYNRLDATKLKSLQLIRFRFCRRGIVTFGHMDYAQLVVKGYIPGKFDDTAYKFAFVRNPYARAVSLHSYFKRNGKLPKDESFLSFCRRLHDRGCEPIGLYNTQGFSQANPQMRWIEQVELDDLGRVENIDQDAARIFARLGLEYAPIPKLNTSSHPDYRSCYCPESRELVEAFYAEDFTYLGYPHEELA